MLVIADLAWKIYSVIAKLMSLPGFDFDHNEAVYQYYLELGQNDGLSFAKLPSAVETKLPYQITVAQHALACDPIVRRAVPLQEVMQRQVTAGVFLAKDVAKQIGWSEGQQIELVWQDHKVTTSVAVDPTLAEQSIIIWRDQLADNYWVQSSRLLP